MAGRRPRRLPPRGLYLLLPALAELGLDTLVGAAGYPGTTVCRRSNRWGSLLLLKCSRRAADACPLGADPGLGLALGLAAVLRAADQSRR